MPGRSAQSGAASPMLSTLLNFALAAQATWVSPTVAARNTLAAAKAVTEQLARFDRSFLIVQFSSEQNRETSVVEQMSPDDAAERQCRLQILKACLGHIGPDEAELSK